MASKNVFVRILQEVRIESVQYRCNDVVSLPQKLAAAHVKAGVADDDEQAVAYAVEQLGHVPREHPMPPGGRTVASDVAPPIPDGAANGAQAEIPGVDGAASDATPGAPAVVQ